VAAARLTGNAGVALQKSLGDKNLTPQMKAIERRAFAMIEQNEPALIQQYIDRFGYKVAVDDVRELFPDYVANKHLSAAVQEPSSYLAKKIWARALQERKALVTM